MEDLEKSNTKLIPLQKHIFQEEALQKSLKKEKKLKIKKGRSKATEDIYGSYRV